MKRLFSFIYLVSVLFSFQGQAATTLVPGYLQNFPRHTYHRLDSDGQNVGQTEESWTMEEGQLVFTEKSLMKLKLFNQEQSLETLVIAKADIDLRLTSFTYEMTSKDSKLLVKGERRANNFVLEKTQAGRTQIKELNIQEPVLLSPMIRPFVLKKGLPKTQAAILSQSSFVLEPAALTLLPMDIKVTKIPGKKEAWKLQVGYLSHEMTSQMEANGALSKETTELAGMKIVALPVTAEEFSKLKLQGSDRDLVEQAKVSFPNIVNPRKRKSLSVRISNIPIHQFQLNRHRQTLVGDVLTVQVESVPPKSEPMQSIVGKKEFESYLTGDVSMPVFDPVIQKKAREIVGDESDLWKRALLVHNFVFKHLKKDPYVSLPDALEALQSGRGDCNEHAVLFTSLARAAGVPARMLVGLVYSDSFYGDGRPGFYYHAWVEVYTGVEWVSIDPTWNQIPSDATHIAFVEGGADQQIQIASIMGKIKLSPVKSTTN